MRLLLIRHGESIANAEGRLQGHLDVLLSDRGRRQADCLGEKLAPLGVEALYSSPLRRAAETAEIIGARLGLPVQEREPLMERNVGVLEGLTRDEIIAKFPRYMPARTELRQIEIEGFEQDEAFASRVRDILGSIIEAHAGQTVAVVTHGGIIFSFCRQSLQMPTVRPGPFAIDNASITSFDIRDGDGVAPGRPRVQLITLNDTCHLRALGEAPR
jgi:broad specificity phosphatase PhoE